MPLVPKRTILDTPVEQMGDIPVQTPISPETAEVKSLIEAASKAKPCGREDHLTIEEAAHRLGVSRQTLRNWEASGKLVPNGRTDGGHRRYTESQVNALKKRALAGQETILPGVTPTWLMEMGKSLLANFPVDEKVNVILSQGVMDGVFQITIESEDGLTQIVRKFQPKV